MSSFVNAFMNTLLAWVRDAAGWLWGIMAGEDGGFVAWVGRNWIVLTVMLCAICMAVDLVVHMFRWRPHLVWASFFRRMRRHHNDTAHQSVGGRVRRWVYADGQTRTEAVSDEDEQDVQPLMIPLAVGTAANQPEADEAAEETWTEEAEQYDEADLPMEEQHLEAPQTRRRRTARKTTVSRVRRLAQKMIEPPAERDAIPSHYEAPSVPVNKEDAYHKPYIPPQWRQPGDTGSNE